MDVKYLIPYLPYKVNVLFDGLPCELEGIDLYNDSTIVERLDLPYDRAKLILHPLSDLTKEIEVNGSKVIICELFGLVPNERNQQSLETKIKNEWITYKEMTILFKYHIDVFGLIDSGDAINIKTL